MINQEAVTVAVGNGYSLPLQCYRAGDSQGTIVVLAALGLTSRFYQPLAEALCAAGFNVLLVEPRGNGESAWRASRRCDWGFREILADEMPVALEWAREHLPGQPLYLLGHSLGGHFAAMTAGLYPQLLDGVILAACGTPWLGAYSGSMARQLKLLTLAIPPLCKLFGYYPGQRLGFGGREARTLMADWLELASSNRYQANGFSEDLDCGVARYEGPVLCVRMQDDDYAPREAVHAVTDKFIRAEVTQALLNEKDIGDRADHYRWARKPDAMVAAVQRWHEQLKERG